MLHRLLACAVAVSFAGTVAVDAHVSLAVAEAPVGKSYKAVLKVGHGCEGAATTAIRVQLPSELSGARPQPKPGWTLDTVSEAASAGGHHHVQVVKEISWTGGSLPDAWYDEFVFVVTIPKDAKPGPVFLPIVQQCGEAVSRWIELPAEGASSDGLEHPAPSLTLVPAGSQ